MALRTEDEIRTGAPDGGSTWGDEGDAYSLYAAVHAITATLTWYPVQTITQPDKQLAGGAAPGSPGSSLVPTSGVASAILPIQRLNGAQLSAGAIQAPQSTLTFGLGVWRSIDQLASQIAAAGGALTALPLARPLSTALVSGQSIQLTNTAGTQQTWVTSAAAPAGTLSIPVNSQTPNGTYAANTPVLQLVGNMPAFGWVYSGYNPTGLNGGAVTGGTGTPVWPNGVSVSLPPITQNPQVVTPGNAGSYVILFPGDALELVIVLSSSTLSLPNGNLQPLIM